MATTTSPRPVASAAGEGTRLWVLGDLVTLKVTGRESGGALCVFEELVQPQAGPPPHIHLKEDETFAVIEGTFSLMYGDQTVTATPGAVVYIPKGTLHAFKNVGDKPGRLLVSISPAGLEKCFLNEIGHPCTDPNRPVPPSEADVRKLLECAGRYNMVFPAPKKEA